MQKGNTYHFFLRKFIKRPHVAINTTVMARIPIIKVTMTLNFKIKRRTGIPTNSIIPNKINEPHPVKKSFPNFFPEELSVIFSIILSSNIFDRTLRYRF